MITDRIGLHSVLLQLLIKHSCILLSRAGKLMGNNFVSWCFLYPYIFLQPSLHLEGVYRATGYPWLIDWLIYSSLIIQISIYKLVFVWISSAPWPVENKMKFAWLLVEDTIEVISKYQRYRKERNPKYLFMFTFSNFIFIINIVIRRGLAVARGQTVSHSGTCPTSDVAPRKVSSAWQADDRPLLVAIVFGGMKWGNFGRHSFAEGWPCQDGKLLGTVGHVPPVLPRVAQWGAGLDRPRTGHCLCRGEYVRKTFLVEW